MRVTQSMLSNNMLRNLSNSYSRLAKLQDQIATQKKFTKPSDDPVTAMMGMTYRSNVNQIEQFSRNISEANNWVNTTDDALNHAVLVLQRVRELTVQASNGTYEGSQREAIAKEIEQLREQLISIGDTQIAGKYIFNGAKTNIRPSDTPDGDPEYHEGTIEIEVFNGIKIQVNTDASNLFGPLLSSTMEEDKPWNLTKLLDSLEQGTDIDSQLEKIDDVIDKFLAARSMIGARQNRIEMMEERLASHEIFAKEILSKNEDIDIEKVIVEFTTQESIHSAALSLGARIIQPTLVDFLR